MLEVMTESHEDPKEQQADTGGRSESESNPESPDSQENAPDLRTIIEQRTPVTSAVLSKRPPERETLASVLSQVSEDPTEIDAVIKEFGARSDELVQISVKMLELVLSTKLEAQGDSLEKQREEIRALGEKLASLNGEVRALSARLDEHGKALASQSAMLDSQGAMLHEQNTALASQSGEIRALGEKLASLAGEVRALGAMVDEHGKTLVSLSAKLDSQGEKLDEHGKALASQSGEIRALGEKLALLAGEVRALDAKVDAGFGALQSDIQSLRRENRLILAVLTLLVAIGLFSSFSQGCSRPVESRVGVDASQTAAEPSPGAASVPEETREPSAESVETDEPAQADKSTGLEGERSAADPAATR